MIATLAFAIFVLLNVAHGILLYRVIESRGIEANPAMRWAMAKLDPAPAIVFTKVAVIALVLFFISLAPDLALPILSILCVVYAVVTAWTWRRYSK